MKKSLIAVLALAAFGVAQAADLVGFAKYEYAKAESTPQYVSNHVVTTGLKYDLGGGIGAVDAGLVASTLYALGDRVHTQGYDVGYSNGLKFGKFGLNGRLGYVHQDLGKAAGITAKGNKTSILVGTSYDFTPSVVGVASVEHSRIHAKLGGDAVTSGNQVLVGADVSLSKAVTLRTALTRTFSNDARLNGLTTTVSYKF